VFDVSDFEKNYDSDKLYRCYVLIPPVEAGNKLKLNSDGSYSAYDDSELTKEQRKELKITKDDKKNCWNWLIELLTKAIDDRHEMLDDADDIEIKNSDEPEQSDDIDKLSTK
jgi:hypothetical protein